MGSSSKKHKKDSKKKKHRSRSPSTEKKAAKLRERRTAKVSERDSREESFSISRSRSPEDDQFVRRKHKSKKHRTSKKEKQNSETVTLINDESDSSDCVEVPLAPPAPVISTSKETPEKEVRRERREHEAHSERRDRREFEEMEKERRERREYDERARRERREHEENEWRRNERREMEESDRRRERPKRKEKSSSPIPEDGAGECLSIEETNKLRAKLGMKPLEVNSSTENKSSKNSEGLSSYKDEWGEFLHKPAEDLKEKAEVVKIREKIQQKKEKRKLEEKFLKVRTLGESDEDDELEDAKAWVMKSIKKEDLQKEAAMRAKMLEEMDAELGRETERDKLNSYKSTYKDKDLKGLKVDHDLNDFNEGRTVILTLKDKDVLDEEDGDTLINVNMVDDEKYKKNVENKKLNPLSYGYNVYEEQYDMLGNPIERDILGKYDEEVGKLNKRVFTIGENLEYEKDHQRKLLEIKTKLAGKKLETLDDVRIQLASDTFSESEIAAKFKKPKKKVKKLRQKLKADDLLPIGNSVGADFGSRKRHFDADEDMPESKAKTEFKLDPDDEDDLEKVLSKARKLKQKDSLIRTKVDTSQIKTEPQPIKSENNEDEESELAGNNIILNSTAEFCRTLGDIPTYGMAGNRDEDSNDVMDYDMDEQNQPADTSASEIRRYQNSNLEVEANTGTWNSVNPDHDPRPDDDTEIIECSDDELSDVAILDEEPDVGPGVGNALKLALSKGYLEKEDSNRPSNTTMAHLQAKNYSIEDKSYTEDDKFNRRDRYQSGPIMDFKDKPGFNPNVKLEYIDDNGRILNAKEAFRYLSHKFHGKGPGKNKIEKRLKKVEQEGLMKTMSSTDTPLGTLTMLQQKQRETKTAYVVLSGNKQSSMGSSSISKHK